MGDSPKISIVVPVYNVVEYLNQCLDSLLNQTLREIEIILINDGSTDNSLAICQEYERKDNRITLINKKNGGQSSARNIGIDTAKASYIGFVDSDDWVDKRMFYLLYEKAISNDADIVACNFLMQDKKGAFNLYAQSGKDKKYSRIEAIAELPSNNELSFSLWNKIYKKELFSDIRLKEGIILEDIDISYKLLHKANRVFYLSLGLYYYRYNDQSTLGRKISKKRLDEYYVRKDMYTFYCQNYPKFANLVYAECIFSNFELFVQFSLLSECQIHDLKFLIEFDKTIMKRLLVEKELSYRKKILILLILISDRFFIYLKKNRLRNQRD